MIGESDLSNMEEKIETVKSRFIVGNLVALLWILLGTTACWIVNPWVGSLFGLFSIFFVYIIIRRQLCNSCYYCKSCTKGLAKLSILFLGANKIPGLNKATITGMTVSVYVVLLFIPAAVLLNSLAAWFEAVKLSVFVWLFGISGVALNSRLINRNQPLWKH
jgi:hypothetical protein